MSRGWTVTPGWGVVDRPDEGAHGGTIYAASLTDGSISVLEGPVAAVCRALLQAPGLADVSLLVAADLDVAHEDVDVEVMTEVLDELVALGVLVATT
ncbi:MULTISPECIES: hypothetical protein [unclassified Ornithinimicrobium]|uniref:hypothetical protein n=1 Tax=unclassified Ornithinimicrobium TaxID=2615080 RepID=UPI003854FE5B